MQNKELTEEEKIALAIRLKTNKLTQEDKILLAKSMKVPGILGPNCVMDYSKKE